MDGFGAGLSVAGILVGTLFIAFGFGVVATNDVWISDCSKMGQTVARGVVYQCSIKEK